MLEARERFVPRGISTTPFVVERAEGARVWDADGRSYVDFAGGIACQNTGHGFAPGNYVMRRRWDYFVKWLLGVDPPREYRIGP